MAGKLPRCNACGRAFRPDRYHIHTQEYCTDAECVRKRKRKRQRRFYNNRYRNDSEFRASERARAATGNRRRRAVTKTAKSTLEACGRRHDDADIQCLITGFVSHLAQSDDPAVVRGLMSGYADRGRRLAAEPVETTAAGP